MGKTFLSESRKLKVLFYSDNTNQSRGYKIRVEVFNSGCSVNFVGSYTGFFSSPHYPKPYLAEDICVWKITGPVGTRVHVRFSGPVDLRSTTSLCAQDYLAISLTGNFTTDVQRICHSGWTPEPMTSDGNSMLFMMRTDCCNEGNGFHATFQLVNERNLSFTPPKHPKPPKCDCGIENVAISERILGGDNVTAPNRYPWIVGITLITGGKEVFYFCGGALINKLYVLTAAHCIGNKRHSQIRVALGAHNITSSPQPVPVEEILVHPQFSHDNFTNDIGLLKLLFPVNLDWAVNVVCLPPSPGFARSGDVGIVAGWGRTVPEDEYVGLEGNLGEHEHKAEVLKSLKVIITNNTHCHSVYGDVIKDTNLCAGGRKGEDSCTGDSGGPLIYEYEGRFYIVGVVSWGVSCGEGGFPGVYTRVSQYLNWIYQVTKDPLHCSE